MFITDCKRFGLPCRSSVFALVCGMIAILISIFKQYLKNADPFCIYIQRDQFASEMPHAAKTVHAVAKTFLLLLWYALTQTFCSFSTTSREPNWQRFIPWAMQCLSQLITKDTVQTCREENAILLVWSQDKYYFNFYEFLKLSRACDIVQNNIAKISLFVMFSICFLFWFPLFVFIFLFFGA